MTTPQPTLLPCPFCGGSVVIQQYRRDGLSIKCKPCIIEYRQRTLRYSLEWLEGRMIEHWNRRAGAPEVAIPQPTVAPTVEQVMASIRAFSDVYAYRRSSSTGLIYLSDQDRKETEENLIKATAKLRSMVEALAVDAERLDWLIAKQAWIQWTVRDGSIRQCQVYDQDEDENYLILSGKDRYFNTPREAIDAAMCSTEPPHVVD